MIPASRRTDLTGRIFGRLTVVRFFKHDSRWNRVWKCLCSCGKTHYVRTSHLNDKAVRSCGCLQLETLAKYRRKPHNLTFRRFSKLVALQAEGHGRSRRWLCECDCGRLIRVRAFTLTNGKSQSCGCGRMTGTLKQLHHGMMKRCYCKTATGYENYGGAGCTVCKRWKSFRNFAKDMSPRPVGTSLSRFLDTGGYWCGNKNCGECVRAGRSRNVEWATPQEQGAERRKKSKLLKAA
jgi:hypothetical protein